MNSQPISTPFTAPASGRSGVAVIAGLITCGLVALLDGADSLSLAMAIPSLAQALHLSDADVGLLFSSAALGSALGYLGGGLLADRFGAKRIVAASLLTLGVFQLLTIETSGYLSLVAVRFVVSAGLGGAVPGLLTLLAQIAPAHMRHRLQGLLWACFPAGVLSGGVINGWILSHAHWTTIFLIGGIVPLCTAAALWILIPDAVLPPAPAQTQEQPSASTAALTRGFWMRAVLTALVFFFTNGAIAIVLNWSPSLVVRAGFSASVGAHALAWNAVGALISMAATGFIVERSKIAPIVAGSAVSAVGFVLLAWLIHSLLLNSLLFVLLGATLALAGTAAVFIAAHLLPGDRHASGIGICMAIGRVGQMVFPALVGFSLQAGCSTGQVLVLSGVLPAIAAVAAVALAVASRNANVAAAYVTAPHAHINL